MDAGITELPNINLTLSEFDQFIQQYSIAPADMSLDMKIRSKIYKLCKGSSKKLSDLILTHQMDGGSNLMRSNSESVPMGSKKMYTPFIEQMSGSITSTVVSKVSSSGGDNRPSTSKNRRILTGLFDPHGNGYVLD